MKARAFEALEERRQRGDRWTVKPFSPSLHCSTTVIEYVGFSRLDFPMLARMRELVTG